MALGAAITDDELLKQLNANRDSSPKKISMNPVTDENLLRQLNASEIPDKEPKESYVKSVAMAGPRVIKDLGDAIFERMKQIPSYIKKGKTEIPGLYNLLRNDPKSAGRQLTAGLAELGQGTFNLPHDIVNYSTNRLNLVPEDINQKVQMGRMPSDTEEMINQTFGKPSVPGEALVRGIGRHADLTTGIGAIAKNVAPYLNPRNIQKALKNTGSIENALKSAEQEHTAASSLEQQEKNAAIREHGIGNINSLEYRQKEAKRKLDNLYSELNSKPPQTLDEHIKASDDLSRLKQEYDNAKSAAVSDIGLSDVNRIQHRINEKQKKLDQLTADMRNGEPVTEEQLNKAKSELDIAKSKFEVNKNYSESNYGTAKENALQLKINNNSGKIQELEDKLAQQKEPLNEQLTNEEHPSFEHKEIPSIHEFESNEKRASAYHENAQKMMAKTENEIGNHLNENADHALRASREMKHEITSINNYWSDSYKNLTNKLKSSKFNLLNKDRIPQIQNEVATLRSKDILKSNNEFNDLIQKAPTYKDVSASDFMSKQKDFRDARYDLLKRAKEEPSAVKRKELFEAYDQSAGIESLINKTLEEGLGEHLPEYRRINEGYRSQVFPLRENPIAEKIMEGKPLSSNIAHELSGDQEGQALLREIAQRNKEVKRNVMGQQYKKSTKDKSGFYNPDETVREYLNTMPELNRLIGKRENAISYVNDAKSNLDKSKSLHDEAKANNTRIEKENEQLAKDKEKESIRISKEKEQHLKEIKELQEKNTLLGGIKSKLSESSAKKDQLEKYHKELSDIKTHHDNTQSSINEINESINALDKHLNSIKNVHEKLKNVVKPEKISSIKTIDRQKIKQQMDDTINKISSLDKNIKKLQKASENTELKLSKKLEIKKSLDEANEVKKEAIRKLKVTGTVIGTLTGIKLYPNLKDYLMSRKNNESTK